MNELQITDISATTTQAGGCGCGSCGCGAQDADGQDADGQTDSAAQPAAQTRTTSVYGVDGMTCSHCVSSVAEELGRLEGVQGVRVDLAIGGTSQVHVTSAAPLDDDSVRAAIDEAGYSLASA